MAYSEIYTNGRQRQNRGHFANMVKIAKADNKITFGEKRLLQKMARKLNVNQAFYKIIVKNPNQFPMYPPSNSEDRITRLYSLVRMVLADGDVAKEEVVLLQKLAIGLGFSSANVEVVCEKAIEMGAMNTDLETFINQIRVLNRAKAS